MTARSTSQAAYLALRSVGDDDSTLVGSGIVSDRSLEYSKDGTVSIDGSSLASSLFQGDTYFQQSPVRPPDWSVYNEERGRKLAKSLIEKSTKRKSKGLLQRAVKAFRRRKTSNKKSKILECATSEDDFSDGEITFDQGSTATDPWQDSSAWEGQDVNPPLTLPVRRDAPPRDLDEISDCTSDATSEAGLVEVWLASDASSSPTDDEDGDDDSFTDLLQGESPVSMPSPRRHRKMDQFFPDGLFLRTPADEVVEKLKLGSAGHNALKRLDEATEEATKSFDPCQCDDEPEEIPTLVTIAGYAVPDYKTYVRQAVNSFRINVLQMSDDLYALLERRMAAKNVVISKLRLLPFAVELYALEKLMISQTKSVDEASI